MSTAHIHTLTNGTFVPWNSSRNSFVPGDEPAHTTSDPYPCPTCPGWPKHIFGVRSGHAPPSQHSQIGVPATLISASASIGTVGPAGDPLVLATGALDPSLLITTIDAQLKATYRSASSTEERQCSAQRLAIGLHDTLKGYGWQASIVDGPASINFVDQNGVAYSFFPKRYEGKWHTLSNRANAPTVISLTGQLLRSNPASELDQLPLDGTLNLKDEHTPYGRFSTLMSFHLPGSRDDQPYLLIPPRPAPASLVPSA